MPPIIKLIETWANEVVEKDFGKGAPEGQYLPIALSAAIPLWQYQFSTWTPEERQEELKRIEESDFCLRMEYVLHKGPKKGDSAGAFNDLAKTVALLSFFPGGVRAFGMQWAWKKRAVVIPPEDLL